MKNFIVALFILFSSWSVFSQEIDSLQTNLVRLNKETPKTKVKKGKPLQKKEVEDTRVLVNSESGKANYLDYKIISHYNDTVLVDTTLSIKKDYKNNFLRKDLFGYQAFQNQGQVFLPLTYLAESNSLLPSMGAKAKHIGYYQIEDVEYYRVPTPTSEFLYKTGIEQGQLLDSWLALNTHKRLNFSLAYRGLRSLGSYRNSLSSLTNFRGTVSYQTKNNRYQLRVHIASQNIENQENGGLNSTALAAFERKDSDFFDRGRLDVNLEEGSSTLVGKRYYINHSFKLFGSKDTIARKISDVKIGHIFNYETKQYHYDNPITTTFFGDHFKTTTNDKTSNKTSNNQVYVNFKSPYILGNFNVSASYYTFFQGYKNIVISDSQTIPNQIDGNFVFASAAWDASVGNIHVNAKATTAITGDLTGSLLYGKAFYKNKRGTEIGASLQLKSNAPDLNYNFYQSNFTAYNWYNDFKNVDSRTLNFNINTQWINVDASACQIDNYLFFNDETQAQPEQFNETVNYFKLKANNEFRLGKFALETTALYQKVADGSSVFRVPEIVGRSTFYFSEYLFKKKSLYLQTGVTANYFTSFLAPKYNAILGDFTLQNDTYIGGKPIFDVFVNGQIRRTRIFVKAENILSAITNETYFSAPNTPYRDFSIRLGIVWNFFN